MANISSYPQKQPKASDLILFSETYDVDAANPVVGNPTKSASIGSIVNLVSAVNLGYTSLVQLLNRTGETAPIATEVYNNTGETFTWSYVSIGVYRITSSSSVFTSNKTILFMNGGSFQAGNILWNRINDNIIEISSLNDFVNGSFEIKIYS